MSRVEAVRTAFHRQAQACAALGSDFTAGLIAAVIPWLDSADPVAKTIAAWPTDPFMDALALRLTGALHALVLTDRCPDLRAYYASAPGAPPDRSGLWPAARAAIETHAEFITGFLQHPPQTNEVGRAAPVLAGLHHALARLPLPVALLEAGASAGLNLNLHRFHHRMGDASFGDKTSPLHLVPDWQGDAPPPGAVRIIDRQGCDIAPIDVTDASARVRLAAYIWPDQPARLARLNCAMDIAQAHGAPVRRQAIGNWLEQVLANPRDGVLTFLFHTVVWQYLDGFEKAVAEAAIRAAGQRATASAPLARLAVEWNPVIKATDIRLTVWPGGETELLGHAHAHGAWVEWLV